MFRWLKRKYQNARNRVIAYLMQKAMQRYIKKMSKTMDVNP